MGRWSRSKGLGVALALGVGLAPGCYRGAAPAQPPLAGAMVLPAFDPAAQADDRPPALGPLPPLELRSYGPEGVRYQEPIRLRLNQPLVDMRKRPAQATTALTLHVVDTSGEEAGGSSRQVAAQARWIASDTIELQPIESLPAATTFEVRFAGGLTNREGSRVEGVSWRFETERPTVRWLERWSAVATDEPLYVVADQPMRADVLAKHVRVMTASSKGATPRAVPVRVQEIERAALPEYWHDEVPSVDDPREPSIFEISPQVAWPGGAKARLEVDAGLHGEVGPLTIAEPLAAELRFRDVMRVHRFECEKPRGRSCEPGWMTLWLSNAPADGELETIEVSPRPEGFELWQRSGYEDEDDEDDEHRTAVTIVGDFEPGRRYRITVPGRLIDEDGQTLGRRYRKTVSIRDAAPELEGEGESEGESEASLALSSTRGTFLRPEDARLGIIGRRVEQARVRVATLEPAAAVALLRADDLHAHDWPRAATTTVMARTLLTRGVDMRAEEILGLDRFGGHGDMLLVELEAEALTPTGPQAQPRPARGLFQISNLGAVVDLGPARGVVRVTRASEGEPWSGVEAELHTTAGVEPLPRSDAQGLISLPGARELGDDVVLVLRDAASGDRLMLPLQDYRWSSSRGWVSQSRPIHGLYSGRRESAAPADEVPPHGLQLGERALLGVQVGRGVHLPGDLVHVAGWAGIATPYREISTRRMKAGTPVMLELRLDDEVLTSRRTTVSRHGRFSTTLTVPPTAALGHYQVRAQALGSESATSFIVADARIPTFEVEASTSRRSLVRGETTMLHARAKYLSGERAPMEQLRWSMDCQTTSFTPKGYDSSWSFTSRATGSSLERSGTVTPKVAAARLQVELQTSELESVRPHSCDVSVAGQDVTFQEVGAETGAVLVHPAWVYVGVRPPRDPVAGKPLEVVVDAVDVRGARVALSGVELTITRDPDYDPRQKEQPLAVEVARCSIDVATMGERPRCTVAEPIAGGYEVLATATVEGVRIEAGAYVRVNQPAPAPGPAPVVTTAGTSATSDTPAVPTRAFQILSPKEIEAGHAARIQIEGPWDDGSGMLTVTQTGLREAIPFELRNGRAELSVTPRAGRGPRLELQATVARPGDGNERLPGIEQTDAWASVLEARALMVTIDAPKHARPGQEVPVRLSVRDHEGEPVDARLAVWVVDEGLHQLREPSTAQLEAIFDPDRPGDRQRTHSYETLLRPFVPWLRRRTTRTPTVRSAAAHVKGSLELGIRRRFAAVPLFQGDVGTGPDGDVELTLPLPDDLTRFRISAVASAELARAVGKASGPARFGRAAAELEVSTPMIVRAALPRVLRPGDVAEVAAVVTTPPEQSGTLVVEASLRDAKGVLELTGPARRRLHVEGARPARVAFDVRALGPGERGVRFVASFVPDDGGTGVPLRTGVERHVEVEVERTQIERAALYGRIDRDGPMAIPVLVPEGVRPDHGGLTLALRSTVLGDLDDAARYLVEYPHGCVEQTASRLLPLVALGRLADRLPAGVTDPDAFVADTLTHLLSMQRTDGSFSYWPGSPTEAPDGGAYATWVLQLAADAGQPVPPSSLARAQQALLARLSQPLPGLVWEREHVRAQRALAVHTLVRAGKGGHEALALALDDLYDHRDTLPVFARAQLLMALHGIDPADPRVAVVRRQLESSIESLPGHAHVVTTHGSQHARLFDSPARSQALVLLALLQVAPDDPRVDELARGLTQQRRGGSWRNTQENAYSLLAMAGHAREREAQVPDHRVEAWIGPRRVLTVEHRGRASGAQDAALSMAALLGPVGSDRTTHVVLDREGTGALFYRVGMEWAGTEPGPARSQGLALQRTLMSAEGPRAGARSEQVEIEVGQRYAIEVVVQTDAPQHYLAIEVPLPAGLEAIDPSLGAGASARVGAVAPGRGGWVSHQELRRDRVVVFADELAPGRHVHTIHVLATTPGRYVLPAAVAEAMYTPEVRARTTSGRLHVNGKR